MKILHKYEDGTIKVAYNNGSVGLLPPIQMVDVKVVVMKGDSTYSISMLGGIPTEIENQDEAHWMRLCGVHYSEVIFKIIINAGMICARALGSEAFLHFQKCILPIREIICKTETKKPLAE